MNILLLLPHIKTAGAKTVKPAINTIRFLLVIMIPVSFAVLLLDISGILYYISQIMNPLMGFFDLPGEAALVIISAIFLNIYSAIGVIHTLNLSIRQITILATICLIAHNFFVECVVMKKTGSSLIKIILLRLFCAFTAGFVLQLILPAFLGELTGTPLLVSAPFSSESIGLDLHRLLPALIAWLINSGFLSLKIVLIVFGILFMQRALDEFHITQRMGKIIAPLMTVLGLSPAMGYVWIVANMVGVAYGSAVLIEEVRSGSLSESDADLLNHSAAVSHSQIEDTLLFVNIGVPYLWVALPRFILSVIIVWLERARRALFRSSFKVKIESD